MVENEGLSSKLDRVIEALEKQGKQKKFRMPFFQRVGTAKRKKGWSIVMILRTNGNMDIKRLQIEDNVVRVPSISKGEQPTFHEATADQVFYYKKFPVLMIKEWDMLPISKREELKTAKEEGTLTFAERYIYAKMRKDLITGKKLGLGGIVVLLLIIGAVILGLNYFGVFG